MMMLYLWMQLKSLFLLKRLEHNSFLCWISWSNVCRMGWTSYRWVCNRRTIIYDSNYKRNKFFANIISYSEFNYEHFLTFFPTKLHWYYCRNWHKNLNVLQNNKMQIMALSFASSRVNLQIFKPNWELNWRHLRLLWHVIKLIARQIKFCKRKLIFHRVKNRNYY